MPITVNFEPTPNPATMKFNISAILSEGSHDFPTAQEAERSPLAAKLFGFPWTAGVHIGPSFVTVTKQDWVDWDVLAEPLSGLIREHLESGMAVIVDLPARGSSSDDANAIQASDSEVVKQIKKTLDNEIRPVVALDGGDVVFAKYENHILYLHMKGSCAGCPSSSATLKEGIEVRMKEVIPEIREVVGI